MFVVEQDDMKYSGRAFAAATLCNCTRGRGGLLPELLEAPRTAASTAVVVGPAAFTLAQPFTLQCEAVFSSQREVRRGPCYRFAGATNSHCSVLLRFTLNADVVFRFSHFSLVPVFFFPVLLFSEPGENH